MHFIYCYLLTFIFVICRLLKYCSCIFFLVSNYWYLLFHFYEFYEIKKMLSKVFAGKLVKKILPVCTTQMCFKSSNVDVDFEQAKETLNTLKNEPSNDIKLQIYALFKQATIGENTGKKPSAFNFVAQAKWNAWHSLGKMSMEEAKKEYAATVNRLAQSEDSSGSEEKVDISTDSYTCLKVSKNENITKIVLNRPNRKNALTREMYEEIIVALKSAANDDSVLALITGAGDYYCSGNDLANFTEINPAQMHIMARESGDLLRRYVDAYIDFPKPLIAAVNGPAIGVAVTVLGLFDVVYACDNATFSTPFSALGQSPEGCSSYTFPKIMGHSRACEMMLFNKKLTASEAQACGLVTAVLPAENFETQIEQLVTKMAGLPKNSLVYSKSLMREYELDILRKVNQAECDRLVERWTSEDCINAIMKFFQEKSNK